MVDAQNPTGQVADQAALDTIQNPAQGDVYITLDTGDAWQWTGTVWADVAAAPAPKAAPAPGTAVAGTTTIDALFTTMYATRSGDLGAATYRWSDANTIQAIFAAGTTPTAVNGSMMTCRFEARAFAPSSILP
jgi:hypothetical protein